MASYVRGIPRNQTAQNASTMNKRIDREDQHGHGAQIQNVKASKVYVFGAGNVIEEDDDDVVEFEMRARHKASFPPKSFEDPKPDYFEREICEGETLQAIALKYACNVSELKRLNNLIQDQEFFALKMVKVPITRYGVLSESDEVRHKMQGARPKVSSGLNGAVSMSDTEQDRRDFFYDSESQHDFSDPETQMKVLKTLSIRENFSSQGREAEKFLRRMDQDLSKLKKAPRAERESLSEVISVLTNKSIRPLDKAVRNNKHNGADCGISWWSLIIFTLVICIAVPLLYLVYYYILKS